MANSPRRGRARAPSGCTRVRSTVGISQRKRACGPRGGSRRPHARLLPLRTLEMPSAMSMGVVLPRTAATSLPSGSTTVNGTSASLAACTLASSRAFQPSKSAMRFAYHSAFAALSAARAAAALAALDSPSPSTDSAAISVAASSAILARAAPHHPLSRDARGYILMISVGCRSAGLPAVRRRSITFKHSPETRLDCVPRTAPSRRAPCDLDRDPTRVACQLAPPPLPPPDLLVDPEEKNCSRLPTPHCS